MLLGSGHAHAITTGGAFAGPTRESGTSVYWNPAALAQSTPGVRLLLEGAAATFDIGYARAGVDPNSGRPFDAVSFQLLGPSASFLLSVPMTKGNLRFLVGGYSPLAVGANWPEGGPQRHHGTNQLLASYALPFGLLLAEKDRWGVSLMGGPVFGVFNADSAFDFGTFLNESLGPGAEIFAIEDPLLEGETRLRGRGFTGVLTCGLWLALTDRLRVGVGALYQHPLQLSGTVEIVPPDSVRESTGIELDLRGRLDVDYGLPWALNSELEYQAGSHALAITFDYIRNQQRIASAATISQGTVNVLNGPRVSVSGAVDDWTLGVRDIFTVNTDWQVSGRLDYDPRSIPDEVFSPVNIDFTSVEGAIGVRWTLDPELALSMTYAIRVLQPVTVRTSLYNPRQSSSSGLNYTPANGRYTAAPIHRIVLGLDWGQH